MKQRRLARLALLVYALVLVYFMFFGFGRLERYSSFQYSLKIYSIPLWFPKMPSDAWRIWIFSVGNLAAFMPLGALIPASLSQAWRKYWKCLLLFLLGITALELLQMLSLLGSFDVEDILVNTMGFSAGYAAWKFARRGKNAKKQLLLWCVAAFVLIWVCIGAAEVVNGLLGW